ncbi:MAG TPA: DUF5652 family protein [Parcubacteria group bacterium]|nr:DUF5652 family protein [Parcubacteria group bacterium]
MEAWIIAHPIISALALIWIMAWKGLALWKSAELQQKPWFIAILIVNTFGLLEIFYLFVIARKYTVEVVEN